MTDAPTPEAEQLRKRQAIADLMPKTPFMGWLGVTFERFEPDDVTMRLPFRAELTNDGSVYHGGVVASVLDTAGAGAAWSNHDFDKGTRASTISMTVNYVGAARNSDLVCHAVTKKRGRELIFTEITATDDEKRIVAHAVQTYRIA